MIGRLWEKGIWILIVTAALAAALVSADAAARPGLRVTDDSGRVWRSDMTSVEIFHSGYAGSKTGAESVSSADGAKLIAPGIGDEYGFEIVNTGDARLDYELSCEIVIKPENIILPVEARLKPAEGKRGSGKNWAGISDLNGTEYSGSLDAGRSRSYMLEWKWPFGEPWADSALPPGNLENMSSADMRDTMLGDAALGQKLSASVILRVSARGDQHDGPDTGDRADMITWMFILASSASCITGMKQMMYRRERVCNEDKEENE